MLETPNEEQARIKKEFIEAAESVSSVVMIGERGGGSVLKEKRKGR